MSGDQGFDVRAEVDRLLADLVGRGYLVREPVDGQPTYHVSMVSWFPGIRRAPKPQSLLERGESSAEQVARATRLDENVVRSILDILSRG